MKREGFDLKTFIKEQTKEIRQTVGDKKVLLALSGGVDSSVCAAWCMISHQSRQVRWSGCKVVREPPHVGILPLALTGGSTPPVLLCASGAGTSSRCL